MVWGNWVTMDYGVGVVGLYCGGYVVVVVLWWVYSEGYLWVVGLRRVCRLAINTDCQAVECEGNVFFVGCVKRLEAGVYRRVCG